MTCTICGAPTAPKPSIALAVMEDGTEREVPICEECADLLVAVGYVNAEEAS